MLEDITSQVKDCLCIISLGLCEAFRGFSSFVTDLEGCDTIRGSAGEASVVAGRLGGSGIRLVFIENDVGATGIVEVLGDILDITELGTLVFDESAESKEFSGEFG